MSNERVFRGGRPGNGSFHNPVDGEYLKLDTLVLAGNVTLTATGNGPGVMLGDRGTARLTLDVTAHTANGDTLDVAVQTSMDNGATDLWRTVGSFAQSTATGTERKSFSGLDRYVRYAATLAGTSPSMTFTISGDAV